MFFTRRKKENEFKKEIIKKLEKIQYHSYKFKDKQLYLVFNDVAELIKNSKYILINKEILNEEVEKLEKNIINGYKFSSIKILEKIKTISLNGKSEEEKFGKEIEERQIELSNINEKMQKYNDKNLVPKDNSELRNYIREKKSLEKRKRNIEKDLDKLYMATENLKTISSIEETKDLNKKIESRGLDDETIKKAIIDNEIIKQQEEKMLDNNDKMKNLDLELDVNLFRDEEIDQEFDYYKREMLEQESGFEEEILNSETLEKSNLK